MVRTLLRSLAAVTLLATPSFAHDDCDRRFPRFVPRIPIFRIAAPRFEVDFGIRRPIHRHAWVQRDERFWVAPRIESRVVGRDHCGRPIVRCVVVREGYWSVRHYDVCSCGETNRGCRD